MGPLMPLTMGLSVEGVLCSFLRKYIRWVLVFVGDVRKLSVVSSIRLSLCILANRCFMARASVGVGSSGSFL